MTDTLITIYQALSNSATQTRERMAGRSVGYSTLTKACRTGEIHASKFGNVWVFQLSDYLNWLAQWPRK